MRCYTGTRRTTDTNTYTQVCFNPGDQTEASSGYSFGSDATCFQECNDYSALSEAPTDGGDGGETTVEKIKDGLECTKSDECESSCCGEYELLEFPEPSEVEEVSETEVSETEDSDVSVEEVSIERIYICVSDDSAETLSEQLSGYTYGKVCSADSFGFYLSVLGSMLIAVTSLF